MDHVEAEGDTLQEAIAKALNLLGVEREQADIEILAEARKGVLGIGARKARVRASLRPLDAADEGREPGDRRRAEPQVPLELIEAAGQKGKQALEEILRLMGVEVAVEIGRGESPEEVLLSVQGDTAGLLTSRGGQTLGALRYLLSRIVAETRRGVRLDIDTEGFRDRRKKGLEDMALRLGEKAKRQRTSMTVEPLSEADRRIVEEVLRDDPWLTTKTLGAGNFRRMLINPEGDRKRKDEPKPQPAGRPESRGSREPREPREPRGPREPRDSRGSREPRGPRGPRGPRESRESRESREPRGPMEPGDSRESSEPGESRDSRESRGARESREPGEFRESRDSGESREPDEFSDSGESTESREKK